MDKTNNNKTNNKTNDYNWFEIASDEEIKEYYEEMQADAILSSGELEDAKLA